MTRYAKGTEVSSEKSRAEIEATLKRYGASHFAYLNAPESATIAFQAKDRRIRFDLPLPKLSDFAATPTGKKRSAESARTAHAQDCRERWRALALCIKAKLEAVESEIESFEEAFLAHIILEDGMTVYERTKETIALNYAGRTVPLLPPHETMITDPQRAAAHDAMMEWFALGSFEGQPWPPGTRAEILTNIILRAMVRADAEAQEKLKHAGRDIRTLLSEIRGLEEATGEALEDEDAAIVADIERDYPEPDTVQAAQAALGRI